MSDDKTIGTIQGVTIKAGTAAGACYVNKVTHPPSPMTGEYLGRPDCSQPNAVLMELKCEVNMPPIISFPVSASAIGTANPSSMLFLQTSGAVVSNYVFHWLASPTLSVAGWVQPVNQVAIASTQPTVTQVATQSTNLSGYNFNNWAQDVGSFRQTYKSSTYYLNATDFNNQGTVTTAKFKPDIVQGQNLLSYLSTLSGDSHKSLSQAIRVSMGTYNAGRREGEKIRYTDDFELVDPKAPSAVFGYQFVDFGTNTAFSGGTLPFSNTLYYNTALPVSASQLMTLSPKAATRPAKEGSFVVQQQEDEVMTWNSVYNAGPVVASSPAGLILSFLRFIGSSGVTTFVPLFSSEPGLTVSPSSAEVQWGSLDWSMTLFEGLTVPTVTGITLTSVPYVTVKSILGLEVQPKPTSSLVTFQRTLPLPDPDAIRMAVGIMHARPDSLPASANDLASIASTALKFIPTAVSWLKDLFGGNKEKSRAMNKAHNFVRPQNNNNNNNRRTNGNNNNGNRVEKQIAQLSANVNKLAVKQAAAPSQLPTYTNNGPPASAPQGRPSRSNQRTPRNSRSRSRARSRK